MSGFWNVSREKVLWGVVGIAITAVVAFIVVSFIGAITVGIFLYYALRPVYRWLDRRMDHPDVSATITMLVVGLPLLIVLGYAGLVGVREVDQLLRQANVDRYRTLLRPYVDIASLTDPDRAMGRLRTLLPRLAAYAGTIARWLLQLFVLTVVTFYLLRDDYKIADWFRRSFDDTYGVVTFMEGVDDDLTTIYTGNLITIGVTALIAAAVFYGLGTIAPQGIGIPFPLLLGLLTGIATLIPAVGMKIVYFPYAAYLFWQAYTTAGAPLWFPVVFFVTTFLVVDAIPDVFVRSYLSKGTLNMGLMMLTYVLGAIAFGWYGVFLAPIVLVFFLHFARDVFPTLLSEGSTPLATE